MSNGGYDHYSMPTNECDMCTTEPPEETPIRAEEME